MIPEGNPIDKTVRLPGKCWQVKASDPKDKCSREHADPRDTWRVKASDPRDICSWEHGDPAETRRVKA